MRQVFLVLRDSKAGVGVGVVIFFLRWRMLLPIMSTLWLSTLGVIGGMEGWRAEEARIPSKLGWSGGDADSSSGFVTL